MQKYAALDVSMEQTAICVVDEDGRKVVEGKVPTCADAIATWLGEKAAGLVKVGMETGPLAVWLWNELVARRLPIVCLDARHASVLAGTLGVDQAARSPAERKQTAYTTSADPPSNANMRRSKCDRPRREP